MPLEQLFALPDWILLGVFLGLCASVAVGGVFYFGVRHLSSGRAARSGSVDGSARRRAEIREYLRTIGERVEEDADLDGTDVAFYLPERDVAITFDVTAYFDLQSTDTHVVLCEHEMPAAHLARRLPFETPTVTRPPRKTDPVSQAYDRLGLTPGADEAEVKAAYRELVKEVHPDQGGSETEFKRVQEAYTTARNHASRRT